MKKILLLLSIFTLSCISTQAEDSQVLKYEKAIGKDVESISWNIDKKDDKLKIDGKNAKGTTELQYSPDHTLMKYSYQASTEPPPSYTIERKKNVLVSTTKNGKKDRVKEFKIGNRLWIQNFGFGLAPFLKSNSESVEFWIFDVKRQSWNKLVAKKQKMQKLTVNGKKYDARKVKISLDGFYSMFWKAELWFDAKTDTLLMQSSNEGPRTPYYLMKLLSKN